MAPPKTIASLKIMTTLAKIGSSSFSRTLQSNQRIYNNLGSIYLRETMKLGRKRDLCHVSMCPVPISYSKASQWLQTHLPDHLAVAEREGEAGTPRSPDPERTVLTALSGGSQEALTWAALWRRPDSVLSQRQEPFAQQQELGTTRGNNQRALRTEPVRVSEATQQAQQGKPVRCP